MSQPDEAIALETEVVASRAEEEGIDERVDHEPDDQAEGGQRKEDVQIPVDDADQTGAD